MIEAKDPNLDIEKLLLELSSTYGKDSLHTRDLTQRLLHLSIRTGNSQGIAAGLRFLGSQQRLAGQYDIAHTTFKEALSVALENSNKAEEAELYLAIAHLHHDNYDFEESLGVLEKAQTIFRSSKDLKGQAQTLLMESNIYIASQHAQKASEAARSALGLFSSIQDERGVAFSFANLGLAYGLSKEFHAAIEYSLRALPYFVEMAMNYNIASLNCNLGELYVELGDARNALGYLDSASRFASEADYPYLSVGINCTYARALGLQNDLPAANTRLRSARATAERLNSDLLRRDCQQCADILLTMAEDFI